MDTLDLTPQEGTFASDRNIAVPMDVPDEPSCRAVNDLLSRVGDKWTVQVVTCLAHGSRRFNALRREIDAISQRMLTRTLRALERDGLVSRTVTPSVPPRVDYALTDLGRSLSRPLAEIGRWAIDNRGAVEQARARFDQRQEG